MYPSKPAPIKTYPSPKPLVSRARPVGTKIDTIVIHYTAGNSLSGAINALYSRDLAYNFIIDLDGKIYKCVGYTRQCGHAGSSYGPHEQARGVSTAQYPNTKENRAKLRVGKFVAGCSVNSYTIGISMVNLNDGRPMTEKQAISLYNLIWALKGDQSLPLKYITGHKDVSPGRKVDPRGLDLQVLADAVDLTYWRFPR
jgi:N-acetyl-anhydromuramyl-L-alanine amidase AmpD